MAKTEYLTAPLKTDKMPPGVPYIVGNEAAERFSYYGMNSILVVFMTHHLLMPHDQADGWYHIFVYYGMNSILVVFMTHHLLMPHDQADGWYHIFVYYGMNSILVVFMTHHLL